MRMGITILVKSIFKDCGEIPNYSGIRTRIVRVHAKPSELIEARFSFSVKIKDFMENHDFLESVLSMRKNCERNRIPHSISRRLMGI